MKITLNHKKLAQSLSYTSKAVSQKPNIPILSNVLMEIKDNNLRLSATNLDMGINMWIPGKVEKEGKTTVSAKYIADFVSATNADTVDISLVKTVLEVQTKHSKASFNTIPSEEFPVLPKVFKTPMFIISTKDFVAAMDKVLFACSTDLSAGKIQQTGVLFEVEENVTDEINFVGLDGFRLSKRTAKIKGMNREAMKEEIIVPARYLQELSKIIQDNSDIEDVAVYLSESKSQIIFKIEDIEFSIRLLEGPYPDYKRIMPDSQSFSFEINKKDLESAIKIINTFARSSLGNKTLIDFDVESAKLKFKSIVAEIGENKTEITVENVDAANDLNTAYNLRYIQDVVNHIQGETIVFETKGALASSVFKDKKDPRFIHLVMPLRRDV